MPQCIPFDEKNAKTWKFTTEIALEVTGGLKREKVFDAYVVKRNYCRGTVTVETVIQKVFSVYLDYLLLVGMSEIDL